MLQLLTNHASAIRIFFLALFVRLVFVFIVTCSIDTTTQLSLGTDVSNYVQCATSLLGSNPQNDPERQIFGFGFGYPLFLSLIFALFGVTALPVIIVQAIFSAATCGLVYILALQILGSQRAGLVAMIFLATSMLAIELSCTILSDSLFLFLFASGLVLLVRGIRTRSLLYAATAGLLFGYAILTRSIAQFWPVFMIPFGVAVSSPDKGSGPQSSRPLKQVLSLAIAVTLIFEVGWVTRNAFVHGVSVLAATSASGPATIAALTLHEGDEKNYRQTLTAWQDDYARELGKEQLSTKEQQAILIGKAKEVFAAHPIAMIRTYARVLWTNLTDIIYIHRLLVPQYKDTAIRIEYHLKDFWLNYTLVALSCVGAFFLLLTRQWRGLVALGSVYCCFLIMLGSFPWQGSRYALPLSIAWAIGAGGALAWVYERILELIHTVAPSLSRGCSGKRRAA